MKSNNKKLNNQSGFSSLELILVLVVLVLIGAVGYIVYKNHHKTITTVHNTLTSSDTSKWVLYNSPNGDFSAYFPTKPVTVPFVTQPSGNNPTITQVQSVSISNEYQVVYYTYPKGVALPSPSSSIDSYLNQGTHLVSSKATTVNGNQAETFEIAGTESGKKVVVTGESLNVGQVNYNLVTYNEGSTSAQAPNTQYFINNFKL
jgi:uncharacterized protein (UPF0333 family)